MQKRRLGKTNLEVTSIGLGAMQFSGGKGMFRFFLSAVPSETVDEIVKTALEHGMNWIDTAEIYGGGVSECSVAHALSASGIELGEVTITTKWFPLMKRAKSVSNSADKSTKRLAPYPIDLYLVHQPYSFSSIQAQMDAMADLVDQGKVKAVGVSNFSREQMIAAYDALAERGIPLAANQMQFSLVHRNIETNGVLESARELGVTIIAYTPLGQGILTGNLHRNPEYMNTMPRFRRRMLRGKLDKTRTLVEEMESISQIHNATVAQVALSWTTNVHGETIVAIPGASKVIQAEQNAGSMKVSLSREETDRLSELSAEIA